MGPLVLLIVEVIGYYKMSEKTLDVFIAKDDVIIGGVFMTTSSEPAWLSSAALFAVASSKATATGGSVDTDAS